MAKAEAWSRQQLLAAFGLYCQTPFGKLHARNPQIRKYAEKIGRTPSALAMKLVNIASLDPSITQTGRSGLKGASKADREMWDEMQSDWARFSMELELNTKALDVEEIAPSEMESSEDPDRYTGRTKTAQIDARVGQNFFRKAVLSAYNERCCITGLSVPRLLIASHIVPWKVDAHTRLNPSNGLCLSALHDRAFDIGYISLDENFRVIVSSKIHNSNDNFLKRSILSYAGSAVTQPDKFKPHNDFISYHRENIFQG